MATKIEFTIGDDATASGVKIDGEDILVREFDVRIVQLHPVPHSGEFSIEQGRWRCGIKAPRRNWLARLRRGLARLGEVCSR